MSQCHSETSFKMLEVLSLQSGEGLTSFNKDISAKSLGEKSAVIEASREF